MTPPQRLSIRNRAWPTCLLTVCLLQVGGCDADSKQEPAPDPGWQVSDLATQSADGPRFVDEDFELEAYAPTLCSNASPMAPTKGYERLSIPIQIKGRSAREVPLSTMDFTLIDEDGHRFRPTLAGCKPSPKTMRLTKGKSQNAELAFDVPQSESNWLLVFHPFLLGRKELRATVRIPPRSASAGNEQ